ncbi:MAG: helix-hairpin-helix domain-containing protein [Phycisphaerales bacterium]
MAAKDELEQIPGVGKSIAQDLRQIGITSVNQLKGRSPERLYQRLCHFKASPVDRCMLYVFRCAVYYASGTDPDPELLKWWNWKDQPRDTVKSKPKASHI